MTLSNLFSQNSLNSRCSTISNSSLFDNKIQTLKKELKPSSKIITNYLPLTLDLLGALEVLVHHPRPNKKTKQLNLKFAVL